MRVKVKENITDTSQTLVFKKNKKYKIKGETLHCYVVKNEQGFLTNLNKGKCKVNSLMLWIRRIKK